MWSEVSDVMDKGKRELCLTGPDVAKRIEESGLDPSICNITALNLLRISEVGLSEVPDKISDLVNLKTLILYGNHIETLPCSIEKLSQLKILDVSGNKLTALPDLDKLENLTTINLSNNSITQIQISKLSKLSSLDVSFNKIEDFENICNENLISLSSINIKGNKITNIPGSIIKLTNLKHINLSENEVTEVPKVFATLKLKDFDLSRNPIKDKRLLKLIQQCKPKQILDYVKTHGKEVQIETSQNIKSASDLTDTLKNEAEKSLIFVQRPKNNKIEIIYDNDAVKVLRPYIISCIIRNLTFDAENLKNFLQLQNKLHDTVCGHREKSTIATHDLSKIKGSVLKYTAKPPNELKIHALNKKTVLSAEELYKSLKSEADLLRKEKKRNCYSAVHKYLYLLNGKETFPCMEDEEQNVISLHPLTNSELTKVTTETRDIIIEISSNANAASCRNAMEALILGMLQLNIFPRDEAQNKSKMIIEQVKVLHKDGTFRSVYPSSIDLILDSSTDVIVQRE